MMEDPNQAQYDLITQNIQGGEDYARQLRADTSAEWRGTAESSAVIIGLAALWTAFRNHCRKGES